MSSEPLITDGGHRFTRMRSEPATLSSHSLHQQGSLEPTWIFEELPRATIVSVSRPDASDITPMLLSYTIEFQYKQFEWILLKKATQVVYLHFALKKRVFIEELHEKQEQVKEWLQNLGLGETTAVVHDDDEPDDDMVHLQHEENISAKNRNVPSRAALSIIRPTLGRQQSISDRAKVAMQGYLNHFLGNLDIVNSPEVCKFLEVSRLSFVPEYGPKLKEDYVTVKHLPKIPKCGDDFRCCACNWFSCCNDNWQKVWAVLKPGFLVLLKDPFDTKPLDIIIFDILRPSEGNEEGVILLARETKERNPLRFGLKVSCGNQAINLRVKSRRKVKGWIAAINDAVLWPPDGWCHPHRFGSFAPLRGLLEDGSHVQWFIDGQAAFDAIASSIEGAKSEIFITGWWLCPELYLRRPFHAHGSSRLDSLLEERAKQGIQVYILLYKEVALALKINSAYTKGRLVNIHENVKVLRYPDHFSTGVYLWSHHEKVVVVDNKVCYLGGLDLCFGRYDNYKHQVGDYPPLIWPGKDFYNPRESEPNSWEDTMKDELDRCRYPRMPWHDVQCALWGPPCKDVARHFVQRWNYAKRSKALHEEAIPLLMPQHHMVIPHYMGKNRDINEGTKSQDVNLKEAKKQELSSSYSSYQDIPLLLPQEPDGLNKASENSQGDRHVDGIAQLALLDTDKEWWKAQEHFNLVGSLEEVGQVGPCTSCICQVIRSVGQWSAGTSQTEESIHKAYLSLIERAEHFIYIENQFFISGLSGDGIIRNRVLEALYRRIMLAYKENKCFRVIIVIPLLPGFQGGIDDSGAASVRAIMHWQYRTICRGPRSLLQNLYGIMGPKAHDYISFYGLRSYGRLNNGGCLATSQIYVHSKLMIIDDRIALIGSANINDRSLLGSRDSEICVVIEDKEFVNSYMAGKSWKAGKFALSLRLSLWSEHLGLPHDEIILIRDPVVDETYKDIWMATAKANDMIYQDIFSCVPNDLIHSRAAFRQSTTYWKEKLGHTTIDLGIAPEKLDSYQSGYPNETDLMGRLQSVRGHLVSFPLNFMCHEDLRPVFNESEFYASPQVFH